MFIILLLLSWFTAAIFRTLGLRQIKRLLEVFEPDQLAPQQSMRLFFYYYYLELIFLFSLYYILLFCYKVLFIIWFHPSNIPHPWPATNQASARSVRARSTCAPGRRGLPDADGRARRGRLHVGQPRGCLATTPTWCRKNHWIFAPIRLMYHKFKLSISKIINCNILQLLCIFINLNVFH